MPPAIIFTLVRNLRNEIDGRRILEAQTELDAIRPLSVLRTRAVDIQEEQELSVGSHALLAIIIRHHGIWLQALRQVPRAVLSQFQVFRLNEFLLLQIPVGIAPRTPHHLLIAGYVLAVYRLLQLGFKRAFWANSALPPSPMLSAALSATAESKYSPSSASLAIAPLSGLCRLVMQRSSPCKSFFHFVH